MEKIEVDFFKCARKQLQVRLKFELSGKQDILYRISYIPWSKNRWKSNIEVKV